MRRVITFQDIPASGELQVPLDSVITPSARDVAAERGVKIVQLPAHQIHGLAPPEKTVAIGADHGGFQMKEQLKPILTELGLSIRDVGVTEETPADYPDIALKVAEMVASGAVLRGIIVDGAGIGSCMAANKVPGVRAALCYDKATARNSREHNDSNVLTLGGRLLTATQAEEVLRVWLATLSAAAGTRRGWQKITQIEQKYARKT